MQIPLNNLTALFFLLAFAVPGFVFDAVVSSFIPGKESGNQRALLKYMTYSCLNYALWSWLIYLVISTQFFFANPLNSAIAWAYVTLLAPAIGGIVYSKMHQSGSINHISGHLGLRLIHRIPTSWDWIFSQTTGVWVIVILKDGTKIAGVFQPGSFASSDPTERDLFLSNVYYYHEDAPWEPIPRNRGMLIRGDEIKYIQFFGEGEQPDVRSEPTAPTAS